MIDYQKIKYWAFAPIEQTHSAKDTMLYALGLGLGADPVDERQLSFVYEKGLRAVPSMVCVLGSPGPWMKDAGINMIKLVHGEQSIVMHRELPSAATVMASNRVTHLIDKGATKGALLCVRRELTLKESGEPLATIDQKYFCRADGGFAEAGQPGDDAPPDLPAVPEREPDAVCDLATRPEMALIYRLSGDRNPLHADPTIAKSAGFPKPILHGLASYGVALHALLRTCCAYDPARLKSFALRFSAPMFPGETLRTEIWRSGSAVAFRARVLERDLIVLNSGCAECA